MYSVSKNKLKTPSIVPFITLSCTNIMEQDSTWKSDFNKTLKAFLISKNLAALKVLPCFQLHPVDLLLDFLQNWYKLNLVSHINVVNALALSPDDSILATGSKDCTVRLWDIKRCNQLNCIERIGSEVNCVKFTEDGKKLLIGLSSGSIHLLNLISMKTDNIFKGQKGAIREICIIPSTSRFFAASLSRSLVIWDFTTYKCEAYLKKHQDYITCLSMSPCGKYAASGSCDKKFILWTVSSLYAKKISNEFSSFIDSLVFSKDSNFLFLSTGNSIIIHNIHNSTEKSIEGHTCKILRIMCVGSVEGLLSVSYDKTIRLWDFKTCTQVWSISLSPFYSTNIVAFKEDSKVVIGMNKGNVMELDLKDTSLRKWLPGHIKEVFLVVISSDLEVLASTSCDFELAIWNVQTKGLVGKVCKDNEPINCMDFSNDSQYLAAGFDNSKIEVWEVKNFKIHKVFAPYSSPITDLKYLDENCLVSCYNNSDIRFWNVRENISHNFQHETSSFCTKVRFVREKYLVCQFKNSIIKSFKIDQKLKELLIID